jgi:predicted secreted hydrolase
MNNRSVRKLVIILFILVLLATSGCASSSQPLVQASLEGLAFSPGNFERADGPRPLTFPHDLGPHPDFQTEWWYYTGNLLTADGQNFGYQLTFFRRALLAPADRTQRSSAWGADQVYLAHFALTDPTSGKFHAFERFERGAAGLAGASGDPQYRVWLQDWQVEQVGAAKYKLQAAKSGIKLQLDLKDLKGTVLQGDQGYSQKGPGVGNASYYTSQTRLDTAGSIEVNGKTYTVNGISWMDHEFSTSALSPDQVGWDWFSIQLDDGSELMVYQIRKKDGSVDPFSSGMVVYADGSTRSLKATDFNIQVNSTWRSPHSAGVYPAAWTVNIPSEGLTLQIKPILADQELNVSFIYWEGAVQVSGEKNGVPITARGYVELTGYAQSLAGRF